MRRQPFVDGVDEGFQALRLGAAQGLAQRIVRFARVVGRENVIASTDCGFGTSAVLDEVHPDVAWAKLAALSEGARRAGKELWRR